MRLTQVYIRQYGPLQKDLELYEDINVIRGPNESGKSLLVEALLKKLADGSVPNPVVGDSPEGFVELSDGDGQHKLEDGDSLLEFCKERYGKGIRAEELRNVFVIQSGDLTFHEAEDFYSHITDKLTGRRVEDIDEIIDALKKEGRLTDKTLGISSDSRYDDAGDQVKKARSLKDEVIDYIDEAREKDLDQVETEFFAAKKKEDELETNIEKLEKAKEEEEKQEQYDELVEDKSTIEENLEELADLPDSSDLEDIDTRLRELSKQEGAKPELEEKREDSLTLAKWSIGAALGAFALLLISGFPIAGLLATLLFLGGAGYFWRKANRISSTITELHVKEENILSDARAAGLSFDGRDDIRGDIAEIKDNRATLDKENQGKKAVLERDLGFEVNSMREVVSEAEEELEALENDVDDSLDIDFEQEELEEARENYEQEVKTREKFESYLEDHKDQLRDFRERAYELDFNIFTGSRLDLEVDNIDALSTLVGQLEEFISAIEDDAQASRMAIEIFEEIQEEEKEETAELFEEGSRATEIFREITDGRYEKVTYDNEGNQLKVVKSTGETFGPEKLSDGTRDQLYLSIRVALGEKILDGMTGFFIMDDAFLTSDPERLEIQAEVVEKLAGDGWQIVYLSSKEDAISVLSSRCENEIIELPTLE